MLHTNRRDETHSMGTAREGNCQCVRVANMNEKRNLANVLRKELEFLEKGGYRDTDRTSWRPKFIFQDSPTCMNADPTQPARPCSECVLIQLVPRDLHDKKIACRYIPLNERGETIDSFYRSGTRTELEEALRRWLRSTISRLEMAQAKSGDAASQCEIHVNAKGVLPE